MMFAAPLMLLGMAAIALPIIIHLIDRSRSAPQDWPCLRFIKTAHQQSSRRTRLKHWLVLLARCLMLMLIAAAMAQPFVKSETWSKPPELPTTLTIVLDNSFSMGARDGGKDGQTRLERAKKVALEQLQSLKLHDEAAVILASDHPAMLTDRPTRDLERVRQFITEATVTPRGTDLGAALTAAFAVGKLDHVEETKGSNEDEQKVLREQRKAWRHVLLITDHQRGAWQTFLDNPATVDALPLTIVSVGDASTANRFVRSAKAGDAPSGGTLTVEVDVSADHADAVTGAKASLWIDGRTAGSPELVTSVTKKLRLLAPLPAAGTHACMVKLDDDVLSIDDTRYFAMAVGGAAKVTVVDGDPSDIERKSETFFLRAALRAATGRGGGVTVESMSPEQLSQARPDGGCLILADVPRLDGSALAHVEDYLRAGGNVVIALGDKVDIEHYNKDWSFLPVKLDKVMGDDGRKRAYGVFVEEPDHPIIAGDLDLAATRFFRFVGSDPGTLRQGGSILAAYSNGSPALVESPFTDRPGGGRVLLMTGSVEDQWSNLPYRRAFVPLMDRMVTHYTQQRLGSREVTVGETIRFAGPSTAENLTVVITAPGGQTHTLKARLDTSTNQGIVDFHDTHEPGVYKVDADPAFGAQGGFAANLDTRESLLTRVDMAALEAAFSGAGERVRFVDSKPADDAGWRMDRSDDVGDKRADLWPWLMAAALVMLALETLLSNLFTRRAATAAPASTQYLGRNEASRASRLAG